MKNKKVSRRNFIRTLSRGMAFPSIGPLAKTGRTNPLASGPGIRVSNPFVTPEGKLILICVKSLRKK